MSKALRHHRSSYWRKNLQYLSILLTIWFVVAYGFGILFVDDLDTIRIGGFQLGFWFAQQGAIYVFVFLIFVYVRLMKRLDKAYALGERDAKAS
ncbi:MAG: DUF4212 domain-containing protein [Nitrospira sp.]|nr:DUF4212 domain-containing protein [Candidatus Manganitrophaceae bacterium]HIL33938.1 DUF4212 domain-containing protein [Candidatus Manganitrophaceae bacterium]